MPSKFKIDFAPEWLSLLALAALNLSWGWAIDFHLTADWGNGKMIGGGIAVMLLLRCFWPRGGMMADAALLAADRTLGWRGFSSSRHMS